MHSNATDDGHKSVAFGVSEFVSLQDSQVKYVPAQCFNSWEEIIGELIECKITPNLGQVFKTAPQHGVL